jgi:hypothetical protein
MNARASIPEIKANQPEWTYRVVMALAGCRSEFSAAASEYDPQTICGFLANFLAVIVGNPRRLSRNSLSVCASTFESIKYIRKRYRIRLIDAGHCASQLLLTDTTTRCIRFTCFWADKSLLTPGKSRTSSCIARDRVIAGISPAVAGWETRHWQAVLLEFYMVVARTSTDAVKWTFGGSFSERTDLSNLGN